MSSSADQNKKESSPSEGDDGKEGKEGADEDSLTTTLNNPKLPSEVIIHPLVLLSVTDHYSRVAKDTKRRVVGVLLGERRPSTGVVDVTNSFAVPFEEDLKDPTVWYLDTDFLENMYRMFIKINAREKIVGFYSTGPRLSVNDINIDVILRRYCRQPVLCIIDIRPEAEGLPTQAYVSVEKVDETTKETKRVFEHVLSSVGAAEAEEVGVEHLLRDINDPSVNVTVGKRVTQKQLGLKGLSERLDEMRQYLDDVVQGKLPVNLQILNNMQDIVNLLPNLNVEELVKAFLVKTNDMHLVIYIASLVRSILALHDLLNNKVKLTEEESKADLAE